MIARVLGAVVLVISFGLAAAPAQASTPHSCLYKCAQTMNPNCC